MSDKAVLVDFGSTYTKVVAIDLAQQAVLARAHHPSTVDSDVTIGLERALAAIRAKVDIRGALHLASSSARGGLRMVAVGLVPELTAEAARQAALGAGAKIVGVFSHELTRSDVGQIEALRPDLLLLAGGTDGGNRNVIEHNARALAASALAGPVIVAGNRSARDAALDALHAGGKRCYPTENVLPELDQLNVEPVRAVIREAFVRHIVEAKGLDRAMAMVHDIIMPTPAAVMDAAQLLALGTPDESGWGDLMVVDVGGATTDVHSVSSGPPGEGLVPRGLPEPVAKRTVEGDLGVRVSAQSVVAAAGSHELRSDVAIRLRQPGMRERADRLAAHTAQLAANQDDEGFDIALGSACVDLAVGRHVGRVRETYSVRGAVRLLYGKDLRRVNALIGVGGVFAYGPRPADVLRAGLARADVPDSLRPEAPSLYLDSAYVFYAIGLLAKREPTAALRVLKRTLTKQG
jgi:uncharacterized protein (TIGR01319 family)